MLCLRHCAQLLPLQSCISAVIFLGAVESATWYFDYISFNAGGTRGVAPVVLGVLLSTVKKCVSRLLVLVVCLGYGVVRPIPTLEYISPTPRRLPRLRRRAADLPLTLTLTP